jgi:predicted nucleic acid-binding Zn ribbon protein
MRFSRSNQGVPGEEPNPVVVGDALAHLSKELGLADPRIMKQLVDHWPEILGAQVAQHATLQNLRDDTITISVGSGAWATQLRYLEADIVHRVAEVIGSDAINHVRIVVDPQ